jgi:hypothetical protein
MLMLGALKDYGLAAIKTLTVLNGGALVALLAFVASLYGKDATYAPMAKALTAGLIVPFIWFVIGLGLAAVIAGLGYLSFSLVASMYPEPADLSAWMRSNPLPTQSRPRTVLVAVYRWLAVLAAVASLVAFARGFYLVTGAFRGAMGL